MMNEESKLHGVTRIVDEIIATLVFVAVGLWIMTMWLCMNTTFNVISFIIAFLSVTLSIITEVVWDRKLKKCGYKE